MLADIYLHKYEERTHLLNELLYIRFVDDLLTGLCNPLYECDFDFYPKNLQLIETFMEKENEINFLDISVKYNENDRIYFKLYDKRNSFNIEINYIISWYINLSKTILRNLILNHLSRNNKLNTYKKEQIIQDRLIIKEAIRQGYPLTFLKHYYTAYYDQKQDVFYADFEDLTK